METPQSPEVSSSNSNLPSGREQRKVTNYLIDSKFQIKYALFSGLVTFSLCALLTVIVLWQASSSHSSFVSQRKRATDMVKKVRMKTTQLVKKLRQDTLKELAKVRKTATDMVRIHKKSKDEKVRKAALDAKKLLEESDKVIMQQEKEAAIQMVKQQKAADLKVVKQLLKQDKQWLASYKRMQNILVMVVLVFGLIIVIVIFLFNIRFTHRAAGPLYKIKQYITAMREGRLGQVGQLRKDDQLQEFHEEFRLMHESLVEQTEVDIEALSIAIDLMVQHGIQDPNLDRLQKRLATKRSYLIADTVEID